VARWNLVEGTSQYRAYKWTVWALWIAVLIVLAFAVADTAQINIGDNGYNVGLPRINKAIAFMIAILGLQVVVGYTGQLALGQSFFFGTGAYLAAYLVADRELPWGVALLVVIPLCFGVGVVLGLPALRIKGLYLALVTLGMAAVFPAIVQLDALDEYTGGAAGKTVDSSFHPPSWLPLNGIASALQNLPIFGGYFGEGDLGDRELERIWKFILFVGLTLICVKLVSNLIKSRPGRAMRSLRDNETSAAVSGVNLTWTKTVSFGVASALGGIGGVVYVAELGIASPGDFTQLLSILFIVGLVVGGVGTISGAVVGGLAITFIPEWASSTTSIPGVPERWLQGPTGTLILGILLIVLTFFLPGGVVHAARQLKARFVRVVPAPPDGYDTPAVVPDTGPDDNALLERHHDDGDTDTISGPATGSRAEHSATSSTND
jgi:branched-chain amino acid transport system permease protein